MTPGSHDTPATQLTRRRLLQTGVAAAAAVSFGPAFWRKALAATPATPGPGPYGPLLPADGNGIMLPEGFTSRVIAQANAPVAGTGYTFPWFPDGQATYPLPDGGWILVTNSEVPAAGGASAIRFDRDAKIVDAYRILSGTDVNCAGGPTPWGTWLSCEEVDKGAVFECDPTGERDAVEHRAMGIFKHEAACVDPVGQHVYLSEDIGGGGLYRYVPEDYPDLARGVLEIACDGGGGSVVWKPVPDPQFTGETPTREQVPDSLKFGRGEGIWYDAGIVYLATTSDETIHAYDTRTATIGVLYNADAAGTETPLRGVDNVHVSRSGDLFVAEDSYDNDPDAMDICLISPDRVVSRFLKLTGAGHFLPGELASETVGITFDPSGTRMYLGSQRFAGFGIVYEITGPFRQERQPGTLPGGGVPGAPQPPQGQAPAATVPWLSTAPGGEAGVPIGIEVARRISLDSLVRKGLAVGLTLDRAATVRVKLTARMTTPGRPRRTVTLATATRKAGRGHTTLRVKSLGAFAKLLRARRQPLAATLEIVVATPGAPERRLRREVSLRPRRPAARARG
ncbi:MAG TPA: alkaline phosphatase PhoX [Solirubrobacteraceae bacterium]|nr:alkaline phosphatase PhoX [Solirubrobacteraceae bacterium]